MLEDLSPQNRKNLSFHILSMIRESMNIAKNKSTTHITYEQAFDVLYDLNEELYNEVTTELPQQNENETAKLFIAKANLADEEDAKAAALIAIQNEFDDNEELLANTTGDDSAKRRIRQRQAILLGAKNSMQQRRIREHRILQRDFSRINREDFGATVIEEDDFKVDYSLSDDKYLRIRLLHPENMEALTGADLVYERHDTGSGLIRVMFLQYKIWDDNGVMYFSQGSLEEQLRKMRRLFCDGGFCDSPASLVGQLDYRFPYCCCFLRPTDAVQRTSTKLISSGIHIPVCTALNIRDEGELKLDKSKMRAQTLTHDIFEPLFNKGFVGSRLLTEAQLRDFYLENQILQTGDSITLYAREIKEPANDNDPF